MTRGSAERELLAALERAGLRAGQIELSVIWPVVASWWREPVTDVAPQDDERSFLLSEAPAAVEPEDTVFAGRPPSAIEGVDLVCLEFERRFSRSVGLERHDLDGGAAVSLWYEATSDWERLRQDDGWIDMGVSTPHFDAFADGGHLDSLIRFVEESTILDIATRNRALALEYRCDRPDDLVVLANSV